MASGYILLALLIIGASIIIWRAVIHFRGKREVVKAREFRDSSPEIVLSNRREKLVSDRLRAYGIKTDNRNSDAENTTGMVSNTFW